MDPVSSAAAILLLVGAMGPAPTTTPAPLTDTAAAPATSSAYQRLSSPNQKIAMALYSAQTPSASKTASSPKSLTLEQIAALKESGKGWPEIFQTLHAQGLVQEKSLGAVVSRFDHPSSYPVGARAPISASSKAYPKNRPGHALAGDDGASASIRSHEGTAGPKR